MPALIKEQIRNAAFNMSGSMGTDAIDYAWGIIEDYVKQESISFAEFIKDNHYTRNLNSDFTSEQLYQLFIEQKQ